MTPTEDKYPDMEDMEDCISNPLELVDDDEEYDDEDFYGNEDDEDD